MMLDSRTLQHYSLGRSGGRGQTCSFAVTGGRGVHRLPRGHRAYLARGDTVIGIDNVNDYYSVALKRARLAQLEAQSGFTFYQEDIGDPKPIMEIVELQ